MRIESLEKGGFYAYPEEHQAALCSLFSAESGARLLDPCTGEGVVLAALRDALAGSEAYANELDTVRAAACKETFGPTHTIQGDLYRLRASYSAFGLIWCNPPYAWDVSGRDKRRELDMLAQSWAWAQPGGYVAWCVYAHHVTKRAATFLCKWADSVDIWRIPGLHMGTYAQVVVVAHVAPRKQLDYEDRAPVLVKAAENPDSLRLLNVQEKALYRVPTGASVKRFVFAPDAITPEFAALSLSQSGGAHALAAFQERFTPPPPERKVHPVIQPRGGQLAMMLAAGTFESLTLSIEGQRTAVRATIQMVDDLTKVIPAKDENAEDIGVYHTRPEVTLALLTQDGKLTYQAGDEALLKFIREQKAALLAYVAEHFEPQYTFNLDEALRASLDALRINGKRLYEVQKHVVGAIHASLTRNGAAILVGEMGVGKTACALGAIATTRMEQGQAALVLVPPHLTHEKWLKEAREILSGGYIQVLDNVSDVVEFFRKCKELPTEVPKLGILSFSSAKLNETWKDTAFWQHGMAETEARLAALRRWRRTMVTEKGFEDAPTVERLAHSKLERVRLPLSYVWRYELMAERGYPDAPTTERLAHSRLTRRQVYLDLDSLSEKALKRDERPRCPNCGAVVYQDVPAGVDPETEKAGKGKRVVFVADRDYLKDAQRYCYKCSRALWQQSRQWSKAPQNPKSALADIIARRYGKQVALVVFDELHELKGRESAQGQAMLKLANIPQVKKLGLTGTISNGLSSGMYVLLFAFSPAVRKDYPWGKRGAKDASKGLAAWCKRMGRLEKMMIYRGDEAEQSGGASNIRRYTIGRPKEIPGTTPSLVREVIDRCIFVSLSDLGTVLPPYVQKASNVAMDEDMAKAYDEGVATMRRHLDACRRLRDNTFAGVYRQAALNYPNAAFRGEEVLHGSDLVCSLPALGEARVYPKEQVLLDLLRAVTDSGERAVVFVRQTATRDIQGRLRDLIEDHVPLATPWILRSSVKSSQRMRLVNEKTAEGVNVLIANARLLRTGVDLLDHNHIIFVEIEDGYQTVGQASRRHWRIGQSRPCYTHYLYYTADGTLTMEHGQVIRTAKKEIAASLLYGEPSSEGLSEADDTNDDAALMALVDEFANDPTIVGTRDLFAAVNARRNVHEESAWAVEEPSPALTEMPIGNAVATGGVEPSVTVWEAESSVPVRVVQLSMF